MQNRYVGDAGDFGKYGLLRALAAGLKLGVVWYLIPDESHNADGKHIPYLTSSERNESRFRRCDPQLYDALANIVRLGERSVASVRQGGVLPTGTRYAEDILTFAGMPNIGPYALMQRLEHRNHWVEAAVDATQDTDIVFLDPDNGIESGTQRHEKKGPKYAYFDEMQPYLSRGQSLIVYHHTDHSAPVQDQVKRQFGRLHQALNGDHSMKALLYRRGTVRAFFVISAPAHAALLDERLCRFLQGAWSQHFELVRSQDRTSAGS